MSTPKKTGSDETTSITLSFEPPPAVAQMIYAALAGANIEGAEALSGVGQAKGLFGRHDEAEALYRAALAITSKVVAPGHPVAKLTVARLVGLLRITGRRQEADALMGPVSAGHVTASGGKKNDSSLN